jgi:hypothetical protein
VANKVKSRENAVLFLWGVEEQAHPPSEPGRFRSVAGMSVTAAGTGQNSTASFGPFQASR